MGLVQYFKSKRAHSLDSLSGSGHWSKASQSPTAAEHGRRSPTSFSVSPSSSSRLVLEQKVIPAEKCEITELEPMSPDRATMARNSLSNRLDSKLGSEQAKVSNFKKHTAEKYNVECGSPANIVTESSAATSPKSVLEFDKFGAEHEELAAAFRIIDVNGDGRISAAELRSVLHLLGFDSPEEEFQLMMQAVDTDGDGQIDLEEFIHHNTLPSRFAESDTVRYGELRAAFHVFDIDKNDFISVDELYQVFESLGQLTTKADCVRMIRAVDSDGDGQVNFSEFERMMTGVVN